MCHDSVPRHLARIDDLINGLPAVGGLLGGAAKRTADVAADIQDEAT
ncbi:hypothetical protein ACQEU3_38770 [Spirillospora sp. CA-253888]